jgi:hypothetical protein
MGLFVASTPASRGYDDGAVGIQGCSSSHARLVEDRQQTTGVKRSSNVTLDSMPKEG